MEVIDRPTYLDWLSRWQGHDLAKVLTGVRRAGKSTILDLFRRRLAAQGVPAARLVTVNLEDPDAERDFGAGLALYDHLKSVAPPNQTTYVFIDEAQHLQEFERTVTGLALLPQIDLYLTGSNSDFLSRDLAQRLTGRYVELHVLPLSYREYAFSGPLSEPLPGAAAPDPWQSYLRDGGLPYTLRLRDDLAMTREYLGDVLNTIILRDIAPRQDSFSPVLFENILHFMFQNIGNLASVNKIANTLTSMGRRTGRAAVDTYVDAMASAYLLYKARRYDLRGKAFLENSAKYYVVDLGMRRALLGGRYPDLGHVLENVVFLELMRRYSTVSVGKAGQSEIDFLAEGGQGLAYFQVCQSVADPAVLVRELAPLRTMRDHYPCYLLVGEDSPPADHDGIRQLSVRDWLLGSA